MAMLSPVRGLRPWRAPRVFVENVPNPGMATLSSRASESLIAENTASTTAEACALVSETSVATWAESSDFFMLGSSARGGRVPRPMIVSVPSPGAPITYPRISSVPQPNGKVRCMRSPVLHHELVAQRRVAGTVRPHRHMPPWAAGPSGATDVSGAEHRARPLPALSSVRPASGATWRSGPGRPCNPAPAVRAPLGSDVGVEPVIGHGTVTSPTPSR